MKIRNVRSSGREIAETGDVVPPGGVVEVRKELAERLLEQPDVWEQVKAVKADNDKKDDG